MEYIFYNNSHIFAIYACVKIHTIRARNKSKVKGYFGKNLFTIYINPPPTIFSVHRFIFKSIRILKNTEFCWNQWLKKCKWLRFVTLRNWMRKSSMETMPLNWYDFCILLLSIHFYFPIHSFSHVISMEFRIFCVVISENFSALSDCCIIIVKIFLLHDSQFVRVSDIYIWLSWFGALATYNMY